MFTPLCGSTIFPSKKLAAQVLVCLSVGLKCWKFCWESCVYTGVWEYYLPCREVGCPGTCVPIGWFEVLEERSAGRVVFTPLCVSAIFPSEKLAAQVLVCLFGWFEVLEVLLGELCLHRCVGVLSSLQRSWLPRYLCTYRLV